MFFIMPANYAGNTDILIEDEQHSLQLIFIHWTIKYQRELCIISK